MFNLETYKAEPLYLKCLFWAERCRPQNVEKLLSEIGAHEQVLFYYPTQGGPAVISIGSWIPIPHWTLFTCQSWNEFSDFVDILESQNCKIRYGGPARFDVRHGCLDGSMDARFPKSSDYTLCQIYSQIKIYQCFIFGTIL